MRTGISRNTGIGIWLEDESEAFMHKPRRFCSPGTPLAGANVLVDSNSRQNPQALVCFSQFICYCLRCLTGYEEDTFQRTQGQGQGHSFCNRHVTY